MSTTTASAEVTKTFYEVLSHPAWQALLQKYRLKLIQSWKGMEGMGMNASLFLRSGEKIADIHNDGNGGCNRNIFYQPTSDPTMRPSKAWEEFLADVATLPLYGVGGFSVTVNDEIAIETLSIIADLAKKRGSKDNKRYFMVNTDTVEDRVAILDLPKTWSFDEAKKAILRKYPGTIIINEFF